MSVKSVVTFDAFNWDAINPSAARPVKQPRTGHDGVLESAQEVTTGPVYSPFGYSLGPPKTNADGTKTVRTLDNSNARANISFQVSELPAFLNIPIKPKDMSFRDRVAVFKSNAQRFFTHNWAKLFPAYKDWDEEEKSRQISALKFERIGPMARERGVVTPSIPAKINEKGTLNTFVQMQYPKGAPIPVARHTKLDGSPIVGTHKLTLEGVPVAVDGTEPAEESTFIISDGRTPVLGRAADIGPRSVNIFNGSIGFWCSGYGGSLILIFNATNIWHRVNPVTKPAEFSSETNPDIAALMEWDDTTADWDSAADTGGNLTSTSSAATLGTQALGGFGGDGFSFNMAFDVPPKTSTMAEQVAADHSCTPADRSGNHLSTARAEVAPAASITRGCKRNAASAEMASSSAAPTKRGRTAPATAKGKPTTTGRATQSAAANSSSNTSDSESSSESETYE